MGAVVLGLLSAVHPAKAQHASDNPIIAADDGFGFTQGTESIGIYDQTNVRGFSPQVAGNARIDGLYFDQQGPLSGRVLDGSEIRVGITEVGYPFPAPTGIVDYALRSPGDGKLSGSLYLGATPFGGYTLSLDGNLPVTSESLQVPLGVNTQTSIPQPGYSMKIRGFGIAPLWQPSTRVSVRTFFDWTRTTDARTLPIIFTAGPYLPPEIPRGYYGQNWALTRSLSENFGAILNAKPGADWLLKAGVFHSIFDVPTSFADVYINTLANGLADHQIIANPDQLAQSTSGEVRLSRLFAEGAFRHEFTAMLRGRYTAIFYGGSDFFDAGASMINGAGQLPLPDFHYTDTTKDLTKLWSAGVAYNGQWAHHGQVTVGIQKEHYEDTVFAPGAPDVNLSDRPWRGYANFSAYVNSWLQLFGGYNQGLEDSGVAPANASNPGTILPVTRTWQYDGGVRLALSPKLKLIVGYYDVNKPYFNFDSSNVDRALGQQSARGAEISFSGEVLPNLTIVGGATIGKVTVSGPDLAAQGIGTDAVGQAHQFEMLSANYVLPRLSAYSIDAVLLHWSATPATTDDSVYVPPSNVLTLGGRYHFTIHGAPATFRVKVQNVLNVYVWNVQFNPGFQQFSPRAVQAFVTVDL